jgi:hypothetical protein
MINLKDVVNKLGRCHNFKKNSPSLFKSWICLWCSGLSNLSWTHSHKQHLLRSINATATVLRYPQSRLVPNHRILSFPPQLISISCYQTTWCNCYATGVQCITDKLEGHDMVNNLGLLSQFFENSPSLFKFWICLWWLSNMNMQLCNSTSWDQILHLPIPSSLH